MRYVKVHITDGTLEGVISPDGKIRSFKGIPYAAPPVGSLRWKEPQPVQPWTGVRKAVDYRLRAMQGHVYDDMVFQDDGPSEDCLYLNLWIPENHQLNEKLPVMIWIHGGAFIAGSSSEPRHNGRDLSKKGVIVVSFNYRLGVFGFFALTELEKESGFNASGNYGLLDQVAALKWVKNNIAAFGGDPNNITIFGESAGSFSVSALMASQLTRGLINKAIGESGAFFGRTFQLKSKAEIEKKDIVFAESAFGTSSLEKLRAIPAGELLKAALEKSQSYFLPNIDGYFLTDDCESIYKSGKQAHIPLLAGWNKDEGSYHTFFDKLKPSKDNYIKIVKAKFGNNADEFLKLYPAGTDSEAERSAQDFDGDQFTAYSTWKWIELHYKTGESPVYRYEFDKILPLSMNADPGTKPAASHASEIEFVFNVLSSKNLPWKKDDYEVSELISAYWTNFAKTGNPNRPELPFWPEYKNSTNYPVMHIDQISGSSPDKYRDRYLFLQNANIFD